MSIYYKDWGGANPSSSATVGRQLRHAGRPALFHCKQWVSRNRARSSRPWPLESDVERQRHGDVLQLERFGSVLRDPRRAYAIS
jgi:hypothetical protein